MKSNLVEKPEAKLLPAESWDYHPLRERFKENAISMGVAVGYGVVLSQIFNPIALGAVTLYAAGTYLHQRFPEFFKAVPNAELMSYVETEKDIISRHYQDVVDAYAEVLKLPQQNLHFVKDSFFIRNFSKEDQEQLKCDSEFFKRSAGNFARADTQSRQIFMSRHFLEKHSNASVNFTLAHEISHTKTKDSTGLFSMVAFLASKIHNPIFYGICVTALSSSASLLFNIPTVSVFTKGVGLFAGLGLFMASSLGVSIGLNYVSRMRERRADRNALFLRRNQSDALTFAVDINLDNPERSKVSKIFEMVSTHPSVYPRLDNIRDAFNQVRRYEPVNVNLPQPPKEVLETVKSMDHIARGKRMRIFETDRNRHP